MKVRNLVMSLGAATALAAAPAFAQTAVIVDSTLPPNSAVVITDQNKAYVVTPDLPAGTHIATDQFGHAIVVDDVYPNTAGGYATTPPRRSIFDSSVDRVTGTVTSPGYMGPRDTSGQ